MLKYFIICLLAITFLGCKKHNQQTGCPSKACTADFASLTVNFVNKDGFPTPGKNITVINLRTHETIIAKGNGGLIVPSIGPGLYVIATDNNKSEFSTEGDDVELTATDATTNITKTASFKISGGCNCHIAKLSGPDKIALY
ncbi:hypothetical protein MTO98_28145 [Mucilaginibacter sp. SMC90]|uniref:hypothetical protein n=1 Tax=Mucilaginibacter sp. SMC90 TaxID=2929803 RepID=UPI001FB23116|nr:hypothetical protein [Mucilaginibacter sp. SMC90]UOE48285.1 hypothetical protein MTO98_28145 [Mucilaginibacter sp. SMC90]